MKHCVFYILIVAVAAGVMLFGCSERIVNDGGATNAQVRIAAPAALSAGLASFARITVSGFDMSPMTAALQYDSANNMWSGNLSVPAGVDREFILEAIDTLYGEGSFADSEEVVYTAVDTVDLIANQTDTLDFELFPVVPMLTTSPNQLTVNILDTFSLNVGLYYVPSELYGLSFRVYAPANLVSIDSVTFNFPTADSLISFSQIDRAANFVAFTVTETNPAQKLFNGAKYVKLARIYCRTASAPTYFFGYFSIGDLAMQDANQQYLYPDHFKWGWTQLYVNVPAL